jgi:hypothetical protein
MCDQILKPRQTIAQLRGLPRQLRVEDEPCVCEDFRVKDTRLMIRATAEEPVIGTQDGAECVKGCLGVCVDVVGEEEGSARGA